MTNLDRQFWMAALIVLSFLRPLWSSENQNSIDNLSILTQMSDSISHVIVHHIPDLQGTAVVIANIDRAGAREWHFETRLIHALQVNGFNTIRMNRKWPTVATFDDSSGVLVEYAIEQMAVRYQQQKGIVKGEELSRQINMRIAVVVKKYPDHTIIWADKISQNYQDHIPYSRVEKVQNVRYEFAKAPVPRKSGKREWFDVSLVGGITGIVIYTFYAFRSK